ncbi:MAG: hypothetical protein M0019_05330 [Actinomycetota bacterium]|nr:hypothetical protein [Actinomycetota bacterium]
MDEMAGLGGEGDAEDVIDLTHFDDDSKRGDVGSSEQFATSKSQKIAVELYKPQERVVSITGEAPSPFNRTKSPVNEEYFLRATNGPDRSNRVRRREYISLLFAILLIVVVGYIIFRATQASRQQVSVMASSGEQVVLNFPNTATISSISVRPGEYVSTGQLLATQDSSSASTKISADQANIASDQSSIETLKQQLGQPTAAQSAKVNSDKATISALQSQLNDTIASENQIITTAQNDYNSLLQVEQNDLSSYSTICPNGLTSLSNQMSANTCSNLYDQIDSDKRALSAAAGAVNSAEANAVIARDQVQNNLNQANNQLAQDEAQITTSESATASLQQLNQKLAADQNTLNQDLQLVGQTELKSPLSGVVEEINGNIGELAGPSGTANSTQSGISTPSANAQLSLFQSLSRGQSTSNASSVPLIVIDDRASWNVKLLVPQSQLGQYSPGKIIKTAFRVPTKRTFSGIVSSASPIQVSENGTSYFLITVDEDGAMPQGLYQGQIGSLS